MESMSSPQLQVVGENSNNNKEPIPKVSYAFLLKPKQVVASVSKLDLCPSTIEHGEPTVEFTVEEVHGFAREEGLHQAVVMKFSYGKPDLQSIRRLFQSQFEVQGGFNIGQLDVRHILIRFDLYTDFVNCLSRSTGEIKSNGNNYFFRTFPWTMDFNPKEETPMVAVWISLPGLPTNLFAKKPVMSIATAVGKPINVDKATNDKTRPSTARVKVLINLLDNHPKKVRLRIVDKTTGKFVVSYQEIVYDKLPRYCSLCKHQGHDDSICRKSTTNKDQEHGTVAKQNKGVIVQKEKIRKDTVNTMEQYKGDAREILNAKKNAEQLKLQANNLSQELIKVTTEARANINSIPEIGQSSGVLKRNQNVQWVARDVDNIRKNDGNKISSGAEKTNQNAATTLNQMVVRDMDNDDEKRRNNGIHHISTTGDSNEEILLDSEENGPRSVPALQNDNQPLWSKNNRKTAVHGSNGFEALELDEARQFEMTNQNNNNLSKDIVPVANMETKAIARVVESKEMGVVLKDTRTNLEEKMTDNSCIVPTIFFSTPHVEDIIKKAQDAMMKHTNMVRQPLVTLNTSDVEIPSLSEHSFEKYEGDSKHLKLSTGIENEDQGQREHEDEEDWEDDDEREFTDYESDDEELRSIVSPPIPSNQKKKLNMNAPAFLPRDQQQLCVTGQLQMQAQSQQNICPNSRTIAEDEQIQNNSHTSNQGSPVTTQQPFVSNYHVRQISKQNQKDMIQSKLVKFFKPMVMLNSSIQDVPSYLDSCGEVGGEVSTDNADQSDDEEEGDFSSTEEGEDESDECEEDTPVSPSTPKMGSIPDCQSNSKLIEKASHFVPKTSGQQVTQVRPRAGQQQEKNHTQEKENGENKTEIIPVHQQKNFQISESVHRAGTKTTVPAIDEQQQHSGKLHDQVQTAASSSARNQPRRGTTIEILAKANEETNVRQLPMRVAKQKQVVSNASKNKQRSKK